MIGKTLGHYRVGEQLGRGGMGEVYVADDLNLNRKVALKFLPDAFTGDPERMARFEREAKLLASLNHPNIAAIYGLEQAEGKRFLVLELVEGETLAQRLIKGALPIDEALGICRQIAEGLEAAHEKGVIHRDLKPANVMISEGDKVKILDFGLAKALADETQAVDSSQSPTLTEAMTRPGVIIGTAAYMSPEQAKGKTVDKRADIWAFGCILYECLTGKRAFEGETVTETLAAVLTKDTEWEKTPVKAHPLLRRCLEKDPKKRLRDIGEAMAWIESAPESAPVTKRRWLAWSVALLSFIAALALAFLHVREKPPAPGRPVAFQIALTEGLVSWGPLALSPDGSCLAFTAVDSNGIQRIWVRELHSLKVRPLIGTESNYPWLLFWSADSRYIAFNAGGKIKKINVAGGPPLTICSTSGQAMGGSWNSQDDIIFGSFGRGIMRVPASGGTPSQLTMLNPSRQEINHLAPLFLPDGKHFLYTCRSAISENSGAYIGSLDSKPEEQGSKQVAATSYWPVVYIPSQGSDIGKLLYLHEQALVAQPFNEKRLESTGETAPVVEQVGLSGSNAIFSAAINGTLAFQGSGALQSSQIRWFDRQGRALSTAAEASGVYGLSLSPKQDRIAFGWQSSAQSNLDIHLFDILRGKITRFTFGSEVSSRPVWSPDASLIGFTSNRDGGIYNIYQKLASGAKQEELLLKGSEHYVPTSWSSDGRLLLCFQADPKSKRDLCVLPLQGDRKPVYLLKTNFNEFDGRFSPDMRWIAYVSDESGGNEIYVRGFSQAAGGGSFELSGEWQVSREGGTGPRWRGDGKELYYRAPDGTVMAVEVFAKTEFNAGTPKSLFQAPPDIIQLTSLFADVPSWDVTAFGDRFILSTAAVGGAPSPFTVILNWTSLLKK